MTESPVQDERTWLFGKATSGDGCWEWREYRNRGGYGAVSFRGAHGVLAHRAAWIITFGPIPDGIQVCHRCDNRPCINPSHLFLGTNTDNVRDCIQKGRSARGDRHGMAKLNPADVLSIRERAENGESQRMLAAEFGITQTNVSLIYQRETWAWLKSNADLVASTEDQP